MSYLLTFFGKRRGQSSVEYVFILALVLGFVLALMISGMRESELNLATGAARAAALEWLAPNSSVFLASLEITRSGRSVNFTPTVFYWSGGRDGGRVATTPPEFKAFVIAAVQRSTAPGSPPLQPQATCFSSTNFDYCVMDSP
ncbi:MAG: hypothetical protein QW343_00950 [Candidatus Norongarragalinales archaeon]